MVARLYVPLLAAEAREVSLPADEADHLRLVLRARTGWTVRVFDGRGTEREGRVAEIDRHHVSIELGETVTPAPECRVGVTLAQAVLKGDKLDHVVRDAVMMGVAAVQPLVTDRTDVPAAAFDRGGRIERWHRIAVASAKQCGRAVVPAIHPPRSLRSCLDEHRCEARALLVEPSMAGPRQDGASLVRRPATALLLVGPEGGWTVEEVESGFAAGCVPLTLGPRTLRADAAPLVALSVLLGYWGEIPGFGGRDSGVGIRRTDAVD
jgi:16S rRNA (uracil1498-N3)-methyltransferase